MHTQIVMDLTGDTRHHFDATNEASVAEARKRFRELTDAGYTAAMRTGSRHLGVASPVRPDRSRDLVHPTARRRMTGVAFVSLPLLLIGAMLLRAMVPLASHRHEVALAGRGKSD